MVQARQLGRVCACAAAVVAVASALPGAAALEVKRMVAPAPPPIQVFVEPQFAAEVFWIRQEICVYLILLNTALKCGFYL